MKERIASRPRLRGQTVDGLEHLVRGADHAGICFIGTLRDDHLDKLANHIDIGIFEHALLETAETFGAAGSADDGIAAGGSLKKIVVADAVKAARIGESGELDGADLLRLRLTGQRNAHGPIRANGDIGGAGRNGERGLKLIALRVNNDASGIEMKGAGA